MRALLPLLVLLPGGALAHVGHIGELAGHDHVIAGIALGAAALATLIGVLKGKTSEDPEPEEEIEEDAEEAAA